MWTNLNSSGRRALAATLLVFALLVIAITWRLRGELRERVLQREAEAINAVAALQLSRAGELGDELAAADPASAALVAVLESSRLRGVIGVQLFDSRGELQASLPASIPADDGASWSAASLAKGQPVARFRRGSLAPFADAAPSQVASARPTVPLLEIVIPLVDSDQSPTRLGAAHYWIDGASLEREFALMDRGLVTQAGTAILSGSILIAGVLWWAFRRLHEANQKLRAQSADLVRANQELAFSAKTAAIGTITAHLLHGLKNPLAGLEGFVADGSAAIGEQGGEAWRIASDTTARIREMVNEVLGVLHDETGGGADYILPAAEVAQAAQQRVAVLAASHEVTVTVAAPQDLELTARTGNLSGLVLVNLLTNAIEASPRGARVEVDVQRDGERIVFHVRDAGGGLPESALSGLFRPVPSRKKRGGGIGLAISFQLARHAGGELGLVSSDAKGTVFRLGVPSAADQKPISLSS